MATTHVPEIAPLQPEISTAPTSIVPVAPSLSPQEIERICKAFIRLITAEEKPAKTTKSTTAHSNT